jgi:hypothetical protein
VSSSQSSEPEESASRFFKHHGKGPDKIIVIEHAIVYNKLLREYVREKS